MGSRPVTDAELVAAGLPLPVEHICANPECPVVGVVQRVDPAEDECTHCAHDWTYETVDCTRCGYVTGLTAADADTSDRRNNCERCGWPFGVVASGAEIARYWDGGR